MISISLCNLSFPGFRSLELYLVVSSMGGSSYCSSAVCKSHSFRLPAFLVMVNVRKMAKFQLKLKNPEPSRNMVSVQTGENVVQGSLLIRPSGICQLMCL